MANGRNVIRPRLGVSLACVDPDRCGDTHPLGTTQGPLSLYGAEPPSGFTYHDTLQCPSPRIQVFETLEDYWSQDFLRTFTDCLQASDFNTAAAVDMDLLSVTSFAGSARLVSHATYSNSHSYQCCFFPSYYQANVRGGLRSTPYYNPLFSSCHDYNCFEEENCMGHGAVMGTSSFPRATPHSLQWYLLNSMAYLTDSGGKSSTFWNQHIVGNTHTSATIAAALTISLVGATEETLASLTNLIGTHAKAAQLQLRGDACRFGDGVSKPAGIVEGELFCPYNAPGNTGRTGFQDRGTSILQYPQSPAYRDLSGEAVSIFLNNINYFNTDPNNHDYDWLFLNNTKLRTRLECCTRLDPGNPVTTYTTFSSQSQILPQRLYRMSLSTFTMNACEQFLCPTSPVCHNLLQNFCRSPASQTSKYCQRFFSWATSAPTPALAGLLGQFLPLTRSLNPGTPELPALLPHGAFNSGVDAAFIALAGACSYSVWAGDTTSAFFKDNCLSLFSTTWQPNFPRLKVFQYGDVYTTTNNSVFSYELTSEESQVDVLLTYTAYSFTDDPRATDLVLRVPGGPFLEGYNYVSMPILQTTTLASFNFLAASEQINELTLPAFLNSLQTKFNTALIALNGRFSYPPPPTASFTQVFEWVGPSSQNPFGPVLGPQSITINPAYPDHSTDVLQWDPIANVIRLTHTTIVTSSATIYDFKRQENVNYLYSYSSLQHANNRRDPVDGATAFQNSSKDEYSRLRNYCQALRCNLIPMQHRQDGGYPQGVANANFTELLTGPNAAPQQPITTNQFVPTLSIRFNPKLQSYLMAPPPTISINPLVQSGGALLGTGSYAYTYSSGVMSGVPPKTSLIPTQMEFNITNTSPITLSSLSIVNYDYNRYSVQLSTLSLAPGATSHVTVNLRQLTNLQNPKLVTTPILFYDSISWQASLMSPDFPVLGGFYIAQNFANVQTQYQTPYFNDRFSTFVTDSDLGANGVSYLSNQNIYQLGEGAVKFTAMKIVPLV